MKQLVPYTFQVRCDEDLQLGGAIGGTVDEARAAMIVTIQKLKPSLKPTNVPGGAAVAPKIETKADTSLWWEKEARDEFTADRKGGVSLVMLGETHNKAIDTARAVELIALLDDKPLKPTLVVVERALDAAKYKPPHAAGVFRAAEEKLSTRGIALIPAARSVVVAAYMLLCVADGNQNDSDKVLLFFGENHKDILVHFEYLVQNSAIDWVKKRPRRYMCLPTKKV